MSYIGSNFLMGSSIADDLRARGWVVAVHNDYHLQGVPYTFWLFTRRLRSGITVAVKGEGYTDADALDRVRGFIMNNLSKFEALDTEEWPL
jgi:hypothetical protein